MRISPWISVNNTSDGEVIMRAKVVDGRIHSYRISEFDTLWKGLRHQISFELHEVDQMSVVSNLGPSADWHSLGYRIQFQDYEQGFHDWTLSPRQDVSGAYLRLALLGVVGAARQVAERDCSAFCLTICAIIQYSPLAKTLIWVQSLGLATDNQISLKSTDVLIV